MVVALCGPGKSGAYGLAALRHLASQGVRTCAYLPSLPFYPPHIDAELALYKLCLKKNHNLLCLDVKDLPSTCVDVVLLALDDHEMLHQERSKPWHRAGIAWAKSPGSGLSAPVTIAIDPLSPSLGFKPELNIKVTYIHIGSFAEAIERSQSQIYRYDQSYFIFNFRPQYCQAFRSGLDLGKRVIVVEVLENYTW